MEAATPLRHAHVGIFGDRLVVDGLVIDDECAVRLVRERAEAGDDAAKVVADAVEIGARILEREQAGANADFVRAEFERTAHEVESGFSERAKQVADELGRKVDEVFGPESGHLSKALQRHFSDESDVAVQNRVRDALTEVTARLREDLLKQFASGDEHNPLGDFKQSVVRMLQDAAQRQDGNLGRLEERMTALHLQLQSLRDEQVKHEELDAERERGTAKGRTFEEAVFAAIGSIAAAQGDDCDAVGDLMGATRKTGDVVVDVDACRGPARGRIVFEAKHSKLSKPKAFEELDRAMRERDADFAVMVVPAEDSLPARTRPLHEYNGDKLLVAYEPDGDDRLALEVGYSLARARVLMTRGDGEGLDAAAVSEAVERTLGALEDVRRIKQQLTGAENGIDRARSILDDMAARVRSLLEQIDELVTAGTPDDDGAE
ncbi:MAG: hypothetical protein E6G29_05850 [Actinobacteria bacterium]|nr:MAG: hypothetical protein E6G29_05850 [Actinomycetota bacterium]